MRYLLALIVGFAVLCASCNSDSPVAADFKSIDSAGWAYGDTLEFIPELADSTVDARLMIAVRHSSAYLYENLWLEVSVPPLPGDSLGVTDTVNVRLADTYGRWLGRGSGVSYVKLDTLEGCYQVSRGEAIKVRHIMRADQVRNLEQIGIALIY